MDKRTFQRLSSFMIFESLVAVLLFQSTLSAPVNSTISYDTFLKNINRDNCAFPNGIILPFQDSTVTFQYFSEPLKICKAPGAMKRPMEATELCNEIYDALRNITCHSDKNVQLPEIKIEFSDNVCKDIGSLQLQHKLEKKSRLQYLTDKFICEMMCEDDYLPACKVLLWSFQLQKRIEGIPKVQSIQNNPDEENTNVENRASSSTATKTLVKLSEGGPGIDKDQQALMPDQEVPATENPNSKHEMDDKKQIVNDDTDKNEPDKTVQNTKDEQNIEGENEIPEEPTMGERKDNQLEDQKQDQKLKLEEENLSPQIGNEALNTKENVVEKKIKEPITIINYEPDKENKINVDEEPPKVSKSSDFQTTVLKNKPAILTPEKVKDIINKTEPRKDITNSKINLLPEPQKESSVHVIPADSTNAGNTPTDLKPGVSGLNDETNKLQEKVSRPSTPSKTSVGANEVKVSIKPEVTLVKDEVTDTKIVPTVAQEDAVSVTTVADLEKMEEGNGIPEPADKDPDLYNDLENGGEYSKIEYDEDGFYDSSKNKKPEETDSGKISKPALAENELPKYQVFPQRNSFGRVSDPSFPEQEDSHFFFYFLSLVLILMAGYLLFHNKQKIIALIVEGRHERRRRSHGVGYKKLDTK